MLAVLVSAAPAGAVQLDGGCRGAAVSVTKKGATVDRAVANERGGVRGSRSDPFEVASNGKVRYEGGSPRVLHNHHWRARVYGVTVESGGSKNGTNKPDTAGVTKVRDYLPFRVTGLFYVSGGIDGREGSCSGWLWVKVTGSPVGTWPWIGAIVVAIGGLYLVVSSNPMVRRLLRWR